MHPNQRKRVCTYTFINSSAHNFIIFHPPRPHLTHISQGFVKTSPQNTHQAFASRCGGQRIPHAAKSRANFCAWSFNINVKGVAHVGVTRPASCGLSLRLALVRSANHSGRGVCRRIGLEEKGEERINVFITGQKTDGQRMQQYL